MDSEHHIHPPAAYYHERRDKYWKNTTQQRQQPKPTMIDNPKTDGYNSGNNTQGNEITLTSQPYTQQMKGLFPYSQQNIHGYRRPKAHISHR